MAFKLIVFAAFVAAANAGIIGAPAPVSYAAHAPVAYAAHAPVAYAAHAPVAYAAAPVANFPVPVHYAAPVAKFASPVAKFSSPVTYASPVAYASPLSKVVATPVVKTVEEYDPNPQYSYGYQVEDALTGDSKSQQESRSGDVVQGSYTVNDPDGTKRTVEYTADPIHGFNAVVHKEPLVQKVVAKVATPVAYAAPIGKIAAPVSYAAPFAKIATPVAYAAPSYYH